MHKNIRNESGGMALAGARNRVPKNPASDAIRLVSRASAEAFHVQMLIGGIASRIEKDSASSFWANLHRLLALRGDSYGFSTTFTQLSFFSLKIS